MDPKSFAGNPPSFEALTSAFGAKLTEWVSRDMERAKKAKEDRKKRAEQQRAEREAQKR